MAPQTRLSKLLQSNPPAAKPAQTQPTATATATATTSATRRRGRPPEQPPLPTAATSVAKNNSAKTERPPPERTSRRIQKLAAENTGLVDSQRKRKQEQPAAPKPGPKPNQKLHPEHRQAKATTGVQQDSGRQQNLRPNDTAKASTRPRRELHGTVLRHTSRNQSIQTWLETTEEVPPPDDTMAGHSRNTSNASNSTLRRQAIERNAGIPPNGTTGTGESTPQTNDSTKQSSDTNKTAKQPSKPYHDMGFRTILRIGVDGVRLIMEDDNELSDNGTGTQRGLAKESKALLDKLKKTQKSKRPDARFDPQAVTSLLKRLQTQNERCISHELHPIVCPPAGVFRDISFNDKKVRDKYLNLASHWDQKWGNQPLLLSGLGVPKPDYCVGFSFEAFEDKDRYEKLRILANERTTFMPTSLMYLPFLTCEVKGVNEKIENAENQNGFSMLVIFRSMLELFRAAKLEHTCSGHIMAFSISYNHQLVYIYAYYPIVDGEKATIYRHQVYDYRLSPRETKDTAQAWNFVRNVYEEWAPRHLSRLRKAIDAIKLNTPTLESSAPLLAAYSDPMSLGSSFRANPNDNPSRRPAPEEIVEPRRSKRPRK